MPSSIHALLRKTDVPAALVALLLGLFDLNCWPESQASIRKWLADSFYPSANPAVDHDQDIATTTDEKNKLKEDCYSLRERIVIARRGPLRISMGQMALLLLFLAHTAYGYSLPDEANFDLSGRIDEVGRDQFFEHPPSFPCS
jgi:hypothetical protein